MPKDSSSQFALDKVALFWGIVHSQDVSELACLAEEGECSVHLPHRLAAKVVAVVSRATGINSRNENSDMGHSHCAVDSVKQQQTDSVATPLESF